MQVASTGVPQPASPQGTQACLPWTQGESFLKTCVQVHWQEEDQMPMGDEVTVYLI